MSALHDLAAAAGVQRDWTDANGRAQRVDDEALARVLTALGHPAEDEAAIGRSRARLDEEGEEPSDFLSIDVGGEWEEPGYHLMEVDGREVTVAVAPRRCFGVGDLAPGRRVWGPAVQIASLRDGRDTPYGDFTSLQNAVTAFAGAGADAVAISPVHALFPADATRYSPYAPSSRLFLNVLYADPGGVGGGAGEDRGEVIDWSAAIPERLAMLRRAFERADDGVLDRVAEYRRKGGVELERHAIFDALDARFGGGWMNWPAEYQDAAGEAVAAFAREQAGEVGFQVYCQWLAAEGLAAAQQAARDGGMAIGLIADLAVGTDAGGSHAWSMPGDLLTGLSVGAPPDILGPDGQDWGITGFSPAALRRRGFEPFIATIRAALAHAGGIRIDHAMGLQRLWVVPHGCKASEGAYLSYPVDDMLRILAVESHAARAVVIGEDLGTVPEGFRPKLDARGVLGMQVMAFEADAEGRITPPGEWRPQAAAMTGTHDLPTIAGWWRGRDIEWSWELGRSSQAESREGAEAERAGQRDAWWESFEAAGVAPGERPAPEDTDPVVDAALGLVGESACVLAVAPIEDLVGLVEQPNLPGTIDEHPNWRRRMPDTTEALLARPDVARRVAILNETRNE